MYLYSYTGIIPPPQQWIEHWKVIIVLIGLWYHCIWYLRIQVFVYPCIQVSVYVGIHVSVYLGFCVSVYPGIYLSGYLCIRLYVFPAICISGYLCIHVWLSGLCTRPNIRGMLITKWDIIITYRYLLSLVSIRILSCLSWTNHSQFNHWFYLLHWDYLIICVLNMVYSLLGYDSVGYMLISRVLLR